ncbi:MAG: hypothetical protein COU64_04100 [Candidatus Pacebacteria bacterium CG10_big_fil_rev_8_21_14_0_10_40_26]|nr:MAG: hypothetical protein COU64_04100 [Candidatus Pacebacteria bacterium CG10_big_fil_rev_8_21_14_0_10_40_26]
MINFKKLVTPLFILYFLTAFLLGSSYIFKGSIRFDADIARDFLLLNEISIKKIILIGPRASAIPGVFHGPLWIYLNYPAYFFSNGNPVAIGWGWITLSILFLISSYFLIKELTSKKTATIYTMILSGFLIPWIHQLLNPFGALMLMPLIIYLITKYQNSKKSLYFWAILLVLGCMIQFQMAVGVPITILVLMWLVNWMKKNSKFKDLYFLPLLLIPLISFALFEFRHDFSQLKSVLNFITSNSSAPHISLINRFAQRGTLVSESSISLFYDKFISLNIIFYLAIVWQRYTNFLKLNKEEKELFNLTYFLYLGYFAISLMFNGFLLIYYWWPLVPLSFILTSIILSKIKHSNIIIIIILISQLYHGFNYMQNANQNIGRVEDDWLFQKNMTEKLFEGDENEFGYFIFTPDVYAYESKAAMTYMINQHPEKKAIRYKKEPVTYLILSPADKIRPDVNSYLWKDSRLNLHSTPSATIQYFDGYTIEKYYLNETEISKEPNSTIDDWIHFR